MQKNKLKLWHKLLIALGTVGVGFGTTLGIVYAYSKSPAGKGLTHTTLRSLDNNLLDFKDAKKYKAFFIDPITNNKIGDYNYKKDSINGVAFKKWLSNYKWTTKKTPAFIVRGGPIEFRNFYPEAIFPRTFITFIAWFAKEIPWGPDISSLSYYKISKGIKKSSFGTITLGSYAPVRHLSKRIEFSPDSFFSETSNTKFLNDLTNESITKDQIPELIKFINATNAKMVKKYGGDVWQDHAVRLYALQKDGAKYRPIISKVGTLIYQMEKELPLHLEKISDVDVAWDEKTMTTKTMQRDSYKFNVKKTLSNILIWKALFGKDWRGLSFEWLKYTTHHEYGHMQTMGVASSTANNFVGLKVSASQPNSITNPWDLDELNRYLKARVPQIRALKVNVSLIKGKDGWDWNFYEDRLQEWKAGKLKIKPDQRDFDQIAFEYKSDGSSTWTRETAEKVFGNKLDPTDPKKAPYEIDPVEFKRKLDAGERPRFFTYSFKDAKAFARAAHIPVSALYIMNAFDGLAATKNPSLTSKSSIRVLWHDFRLDATDIVDQARYFDEIGRFAFLKNVLLGIKTYNGVNLLLEDVEVKTTYFFQLSSINYKINPLARDKKGHLLTSKASELKSLLTFLVAKSKDNGLEGAESILSLIARVGTSSRGVSSSLFVRPDFSTSAGQIQIKKWFQSINVGPASNINDPFAHYVYNFAEVLTRDWVQITHPISQASKYNYNSQLFPINVKNFGIETFVDPTSLINAIANKTTKKTYKQLMNPYYVYKDDPSPRKRLINLDYKIDFIRTMFADLKTSGSQGVAKTFVPKAVLLTRFTATQMGLHLKSLSFLNIERFITSGGRALIIKDRLRWLLNWRYLVNSKERNLCFGLSYKGWGEIRSHNKGYFDDRWQRASLAPSRAANGTKDSWALYDNDGNAIPYRGDLKKINGQPVQTRPEAFWTYFLKSNGVGLRNISAFWLSPERDAVTLWGYIPTTYKTQIKYLQFRNLKTNEKFQQLVKFDVDNLFYYDQAPGGGHKIKLADEGFVSWNINYIPMGSWIDSSVPNGNYQINFIDQKGRIIDIKWQGKRLTMTGNGNMKTHAYPKTTNHIVTLNWFSKIFTPIFIEQNKRGQDIIHVRNEFPI